MRPLRLLLIAVTAGLSSLALCQSPWLQQNSINWGTFKSGAHSRISERSVFHLVSEGQFQDYWQRATGNAAGTAPKGVDWAKQMLVAIHLGNRPTSGYNAVVQRVQKAGANAVISAVEETPIPGQYVADVISSPWVIIRVDRSAGNLQVTWEQRQARPAIILGPGGAYYGPKDNDGAGWVDPRFQVGWGTVRRGLESDVLAPGMFVMTNDWEFRDYYRRAFRGPVPNAPVDWSREQLVAIHLGERQTTGFEVSVRNVVRNGNAGVITAVEETPVPGQMVTRRRTQPYVLIRVERGVGPFQLSLSSRQSKSGIAITGG